MKNHALLFILVVSLVAIGSFAAPVAERSTAIATAQPTPAGVPQTGSPEALIADLYKAHKSKRTDPFFDSKSRVTLDKYFTKSLADLIWNDSVNSAKNNEVGVIDGDPLYDAQDMEIKNFAIGKAEINGDSGVVPVTFTNFGKKQTIKFDITRVANTWKVDDIDYGSEEGTMRSWFKSSK